MVAQSALCSASRGQGSAVAGGAGCSLFELLSTTELSATGGADVAGSEFPGAEPSGGTGAVSLEEQPADRRTSSSLLTHNLFFALSNRIAGGSCRCL